MHKWERSSLNRLKARLQNGTDTWNFCSLGCFKELECNFYEDTYRCRSPRYCSWRPS